MRYLFFNKFKFTTKLRDEAFSNKHKVPFYRNKSYIKNGKGVFILCRKCQKRARQSKINAFALQSVAKNLCKATA